MNTTQHTAESLLTGFAAQFVNRTRPYAVQQADGTYRWRYDSLTPALLSAHLRGETTLAVSSSDEAGLCRWLCLDLDTKRWIETTARLEQRAGEAWPARLGRGESPRRPSLDVP